MQTSYSIAHDFYSRKNNKLIPYRNDKELRLIKMFETDSIISSYEMFLLPILNKTGQLIEEAIGFIVRRGSAISYVVISAYLDRNPEQAARMKVLICRGKEWGEVTVLTECDISEGVDVSQIK